MINFVFLDLNGKSHLYYNALKRKLVSQYQSLSSFTINLFNSLLRLRKVNLGSEETIEQLVRFEKLSIFFRASRFGFNQNVPHRSTKSGYLNLIVRAIGQIYLIRLVCLIFIDDESYQLYLGDVAYKTKHRTTIHILLFISFLIRVVAYEWLLLFDKSGKYSVLSIYSSIINHGFDPNLLQMTSNQTIKFQRTIHLLSGQLNRSYVFSCIFLATLNYSILLSNPHFYQVKELVFYSLTWSLATMVASFSMTGQNVGTFGYLILIQVYHLFRLRSVVELAESYRESKCTDELASTFIKHTTECLNQSEKCAKMTRNIVLYGFTVIAFIGDLALFYGFIIRYHSSLFANVSCAMGFIVFIILACISLIARHYMIEIERLNSLLHVICRNNVFDACNQMKITQLMDRLNGPYNGIQLGQITAIRKDFFINFMLEIGSSLMLFTCNFKRYF